MILKEEVNCESLWWKKEFLYQHVMLLSQDDIYIHMTHLEDVLIKIS